MKNFLLKLRVFWRRTRRVTPPEAASGEQVARLDALLRRANPFASWQVRANWAGDVAAWLRGDAGRPAALLAHLDAQRDLRRVVRTTMQKTLREAAGSELFGTAGLPQEPGVAGEVLQRLGDALLPRSTGRGSLAGLLRTVFPRAADAAWLQRVNAADLQRLWRLCADDGIAHAMREQIDEALHYLTAMIIAVGVRPDFQQRLEPRMPIQATPFMALRRELEKYLAGSAHDDAALRSVRMLIAVCQAQTDRIYAHLDEHGVAVGLVYRVERMRAQLVRMARLIDLRAATPEEGLVQQACSVLADLVGDMPRHTTMSALMRRSFTLLARKMVERNAARGEPHSVLGAREYRRMLTAGARGGVALAAAALVRATVSMGTAARFVDGALASLGYAGMFAAAASLGGVIGGRFAATATPALAARAESLETIEGLRRFAGSVAAVARAQAAALAGNLAVVLPLAALATLAARTFLAVPVMTPAAAQTALERLHAPGGVLLGGLATGVLLWLASLAAGFADNVFALRRMREALAQQRRVVRILGAARAQRLAAWLERHVAGIAGSLVLGVIFGMTPAIAGFFGVPVDIRHAGLAAGDLATAAAALGAQALTSLDFWLAAGGVVATALANVGGALACAVALALRSRGVPLTRRRPVYRAVLRCLVAGPRYFLLPEPPGGSATSLPVPPAAVARKEEERRSGVGGG